MPKSPKKHPHDMTDEEALKHVFHPKIVASVKKHLKKHNQGRSTKAGKQ